MKTTLDVVIVNYNVCFFLEQALFSLLRACQRMEAAGLHTQVWVVDNNSVDGSVEMVREKFPWVQLIANGENLGFSRANNQALRQGHGQYVLLLNPDTVVEENTLLDGVRFMEQHPEAGGLGVKMLDGKGRFLPESKRGLPTPWVAFYKMSGLASLFKKNRRLGRYHLSYLDPDQTHEIEVLAGAFMMMRRSALDRVGLLDEDFFMYGEDIDLSYRLLQAGFKNYYFPGVRIIHYKGESTKKASVNYVLVFYRAMILFARKHFTSRKARIFTFLIQGAIYLRAGAAVLHRLAQQMALPFLDMILLFLGHNLITQFYARAVKNDPDYYTDLTYQWMLPVAVVLMIIGLNLAGAYRRPFSFQKTLRGSFLGGLMLIVAYAFLPNSYRFSRGLILLWPALGSLWAHAARMVHRSVQERRLAWSEDHCKRLLIVGQQQEANRARRLIEDAMPHHRVLGFIYPEEYAAPEASAFLGHLGQMDEILHIHRPDEIIFCARDLPSRDIISWMMHLSRKDVYFKIVPEKSLFIIGSNSKNKAGDFYTLQLDLNLARPEVRRMKRGLDLVLSLLLLLSSPLWWMLWRRPAMLMRNIWSVVQGRRSWVGYSTHQPPRQIVLPPLPEGIIPAGERAPSVHAFNGQGWSDLEYARDYHIGRDLRLIYQNFQMLDQASS